MAGRCRATATRLSSPRHKNEEGSPMSNASIAEPLVEGQARARLGFLPLALCAATMFVEGYDAQLMGYVVPGIARDWGVAPTSLTPAIAFGLIGMALGA